MIDEGSESTATVRQELEATRQRMSGTIAELELRVSTKVQGIKRKVDVMEMVKENPWPALAVAFVAGVALSTTGADARAARAAARAAKRAPETAKRGAAGVSQLASKAVDRFKSSSSDDRSAEPGGIRGKASGALRELGEEVRRGVDELSRL
jgi:hypothetical protein